MSDPQTSLLETVAGTLITESNTALTNAGMTVPGGPGFCHMAPVIPFGTACPDVLGVWFDAIDARAYGERRPSTPGAMQRQGYHTVLPARIDYWRYHIQSSDDGRAEPEAAEINLNAGQLARGAWAIWCRLCNLRDTEQLFTSIGGMTVTKADIGIGSMKPLPITGAAAGWRIQLELAVPSTFGG